MRKRFIAFYDALCFAIMAGIMWSAAIVILVTGHLGDFDWCVQNWYLVLTFAVCIATPTTALFCLQKITIDLSCDKVQLFYLVNYRKNDKDLHSNWVIYPSEIESIKVVNLSKEEKLQHTSAKFLFSKYLKINLKYGHCKYVYVSHYSNSQIKKIIHLLSNTRV